MNSMIGPAKTGYSTAGYSTLPTVLTRGHTLKLKRKAQCSVLGVFSMARRHALVSLRHAAPSQRHAVLFFRFLGLILL